MDSLQTESLTEDGREAFSGFSLPAPEFIEGGGSLLEPLLAGYPKLVPALHDISQYCSPQKHHVLSSRRVFDPDFEFLWPIPINRPQLEDVIDQERTFKRVGSPWSTRVRYSCFISFSRRDGSPGYILEPPERTTCLYSSVRMSTAADWIVLKSISVGDIGCLA